MNNHANDDPTGLYYHGTRADLKPGDLIVPGFASNYGQRRTASWVYFTATLDAAIWGAELAQGEARERIYIVEPTGAMVDDPNLTDQKYPGNPTRSYRTQSPLRVTGEVAQWQRHDAERLQQMKEAVRRAKEAGLEAMD
jgi:rifampin ADP-ribosylating transferase